MMMKKWRYKALAVLLYIASFSSAKEEEEAASLLDNNQNLDGQESPSRDLQGEISTRIVGGSIVPESEDTYRFIASLQRKEKGRFYTFCGGSLIHPSWILTAAHCLRHGKPQRVQVGKYDLRSRSGGATRSVTLALAHPLYDENTSLMYDIALLKLNKPIHDIPTVYVNEKIFASPEEDPDTIVHVVGWGYEFEGSGFVVDNLRHVHVPIVSYGKCRRAYSEVDRTYQLCAGYEFSGHDACTGDSGGPLTFVGKDRIVLVGVVSYGRGCARGGLYTVYSRVSSYMDFIQKTMQDNGRDFLPDLVRFSPRPTPAPTIRPTGKPTERPTKHPTPRPITRPTRAPTFRPTKAPTILKTKRPTRAPTFRPTKAPTPRPTFRPTKLPTKFPTQSPIPTPEPTQQPTHTPTDSPTATPTQTPTRTPSVSPTKQPTNSALAAVERTNTGCSRSRTIRQAMHIENTMECWRACAQDSKCEFFETSESPFSCELYSKCKVGTVKGHSLYRKDDILESQVQKRMKCAFDEDESETFVRSTSREVCLQSCLDTRDECNFIFINYKKRMCFFYKSCMVVPRNEPFDLFELSDLGL